MQLNTQILGDGPSVLLLHGLLGSSDNWLPTAKALADAHRVYAIDLRNHGRSPHDNEFNYEVMVEDLRELMTTHHITKASVLGHSMGGKVAMHFALKHPEAIERLIVVDMAPRAYPPQHVEIFEALLSLNLSQFSARTEIDMALQSKLPDAALRQFLLKNLTRNQAGAFQWKIPVEIIYKHYHPLNEPITGETVYEQPTLFIRGGRSDYIRDADLPMIKKLFRRSEIVTIASAGHWVHADAVREFIGVVQKFLAQ